MVYLPRITFSVLALRPRPARVTGAPHVLTVTMEATVEATLVDTTVWTRPALVTPALVGLEVHQPVTSTSWDTLPRCGVKLTTVRPQPAFLADTEARDAVSMA